MEAGKGHPKEPGTYTLTHPGSSRVTDHRPFPTPDITCHRVLSRLPCGHSEKTLFGDGMKSDLINVQLQSLPQDLVYSQQGKALRAQKSSQGL